MKYAVAIILGALGVCLLVGWGIVTHRVQQRAAAVQQHTAALRATLAAASIQDLAHQYGECFPLEPAARPKRDPAYCVEVVRALEDRPLQAVTVPKPASRPLLY